MNKVPDKPELGKPYMTTKCTHKHTHTHTHTHIHTKNVSSNLHRTGNIPN